MKGVKLKPEANLQGRYVVIGPAIFEDTFPYKEPYSIVIEVVRILTGRSGLRITADSRDFPFSKSPHWFRAHLASYLMGTVVLFQG